MLPKAPESFLTLLAGESYVGKTNQLIYTVLGSCVCLVLWDREKKVMAMNHYLLPKGPSLSDDIRYGNISNHLMLNKLRKSTKLPLLGAIIGGGDVIALRSNGASIGQLNIDEGLHFLKTHQIQTKATITGGRSGRRVWFSPHDSSIKVLSHETGGKWQIIKL